MAGLGTDFMDEFGQGADDYQTRVNQDGSTVAQHQWYGWDPNAAGTAADQATTTGNAGQDRTTLLNQAAGINAQAGAVNQTADGFNGTMQNMDQTSGALTGLASGLMTAPSAATAASTAAEQVGNAQAMSQAASSRGTNAALMQREAMSNNDATDRGIASNAATAAANEQAQRYSTSAGILNQAAGVQGQVAGVRSDMVGAQTGAGNLLNAAAGVQGTAQSGDLTQRGQDLNATTSANQLTQQSDDAGYAAMAAKDAKTSADEGSTVDSALSMGSGMLSDMRLKTDVQPLSPSAMSAPPTPAPAPTAAPSSGGNSAMMSTIMGMAGGSGGAGAGAMSMMSDKELKTDRRKLAADDATDSELTKLLRKATDTPTPRAQLDTRGVGRSYDRNALDASQLASGGSLYGQSSAPAGVPTARFADYQPPTARFADVPPAQPALQLAAPTAPAPSPAPAQYSNPGYDVAALDAANARQSGPVPQYMMSDRELKTDREKMLDMATQPEANKENLDPVDGFTYRYKPEAAARIGEDTGVRPGVMAQDLEKTPAGKTVVDDTPNGKALDIHRAIGFSLAGVAGLDKRMQRLEAAAGGRRKSAA